MLSDKQRKRYARHLMLPGIGEEGQERLCSAKVLVVGAGGLGCPVLQYLAAAGTGTIGILDFDSVEESNLQRQVLYTTEDVGKPKAAAAAARLSAMNPLVNFRIHHTMLDRGNALEIPGEYDLVVDGSDNFPTRYLVNDACVILGKPLVFGSIFRFEGQVSVFNYRGGPTYRCLFPEPPAESLNCSETGVLGVLPGIIGTLQANEAIKIITGQGEVLSGKLLLLDALNSSFSMVSFGADEKNKNIRELRSDYGLICTPAEIREISHEAFGKMIAGKEDFQLVDVREPSEYKKFNIGGDLIPLGEIEKHLGRISRTRKVVIHCKAGGRSRQAVKILQEKHGYANLYNLTGGIRGWGSKC